MNYVKSQKRVYARGARVCGTCNARPPIWRGVDCSLTPYWVNICYPYVIGIINSWVNILGTSWE
jgi:hypothetical protein